MIVTRKHAAPPDEPPSGSVWRARLHTVVSEADTPAGRAFDLALIALIIGSVLVVSLETLPGLSAESYTLLRRCEWVLTALFTIEYALRLVAVQRPRVYAMSFYGLVDLLAILPTWISLLVPGAGVLLVVRVLRLLRIVRVLKLSRYLVEADVIGTALRASARKIGVFLLAVTTIVVIVGSVMYLVEGPAHGFTSVPISMYWAVVTLTTVGYGDLAPATALGKAIASLVMIPGYGIIAVPTGIVTAEFTHRRDRAPVLSTQVCGQCELDDHAADASYCRRCAARL